MRTSAPRLGGIQADPQALTLADEMMARDDVMADILDETIPNEEGATVTESGRTVCGPSNEIHGPLARFPTAVELASCPANTQGGTWHTHVTQEQLKNPTNSLPDTANVIFGEIDVSIVAGTQSAEAVVAASDREAAKATFRDALGADVSSTDEVIDAILSGQVHDPPDVRSRVRSQMGSLFQTRRMNFTELDGRLEQSGIPARSVISFELMDARHHAMVAQELRSHSHRKNPGRDAAGMKSYLRAKNNNAKRAAKGMRLHEYAARSAVGELVSRGVRTMF